MFFLWTTNEQKQIIVNVIFIMSVISLARFICSFRHDISLNSKTHHMYKRMKKLKNIGYK